MGRGCAGRQWCLPGAGRGGYHSTAAPAPHQICSSGACWAGRTGTCFLALVLPAEGGAAPLPARWRLVVEVALSLLLYSTVGVVCVGSIGGSRRVGGRGGHPGKALPIPELTSEEGLLITASSPLRSYGDNQAAGRELKPPPRLSKVSRTGGWDPLSAPDEYPRGRKAARAAQLARPCRHRHCARTAPPAAPVSQSPCRRGAKAKITGTSAAASFPLLCHGVHMRQLRRRRALAPHGDQAARGCRHCFLPD